jgi:triacylglycerol lipase
MASENVSHVDIVAHSQGGLVARWFIQQLGGSDRVRRLVELAVVNNGSDSAHWSIGCPRADVAIGSRIVSQLNPPPPDAPFTAIWSTCDEIAVPREFARLYPDGDRPADEFRLNSIGHMSVLLSRRVANIARDRLR